MDLRYLIVSPKAKQRTAWQHRTVRTRHTRLAPDIVIVVDVNIFIDIVIVIAILMAMLVIKVCGEKAHPL